MADCIEVVGAGDGGVDEMALYLDDSRVNWALCQFSIGGGSLTRHKMLFLHFNGDDCPVMQRGKANALTHDVQMLCRGKNDEDGGFHASLEAKRREEVSAKHIFENQRLKMLVADVMDHSVDQLLKAYEQQIAEGKQIDEKGSSAASEGLVSNTVRKIRWGQGASLTFKSGRDALKAVMEPMGPWNWIFFHPAPDNLMVVDGGDGSVNEMQECMEAMDENVLFGILRMGFGQGRLRRTKFIFVQSNGKRVSPVKRGRLAAVRPKMEELLKGFSVSMMVSDPEQFTLEKVIDKVRSAATVDDEVIEGDKGLDKSAFTVEGFLAALEEERTAAAETSANDQDSSLQQSHIPGAGMPLEKALRLLRTPDAPLNWALFGPSDEKRMKSLSPRPSQCSSSPQSPNSKNLSPRGFHGAGNPQSPSNSPSIAHRKTDPSVKANLSVKTGSQLTVPSGSGLTSGASTEKQRSSSPCISPATPLAGHAGGYMAAEKRRIEAGGHASPEAGATSAVSTTSRDHGKEGLDERLTVKGPAGGFLGAAQRRTEAAGNTTTVASPPQPSLPIVAGVALPIVAGPAGGFQEAEKRRSDAAQHASPTVGGQTAVDSNDVCPVEARLSGPLLKESTHWLRGWQLRWFEVGSGCLKWWDSPDDCRDGKEAKGTIRMSGLKVSMIQGSNSRFQVSGDNEKDKVYVLDANVSAKIAKAGWKAEHVVKSVKLSPKQWIKALEQEAIFRRRTLY